MKKVMLMAAAALMTTAAFSQVKFGAQAIGNFSSASVEGSEAGAYKKSMKPGFGVGVVSEVKLGESLSLRPSLSFLQKGVKMKGSERADIGSFEGEMTVNLNYLELPVIVAYNLKAGENIIYFGAGPSVGFGISGKSKSTVRITFPGVPTQHRESIVESFKKESEDGAGFKRLDVSANVIAGIQFKSGMFVNAGGLLGLSNISGDDSKYKNIGGQLTVGFLLNKK